MNSPENRFTVSAQAAGVRVDLFVKEALQLSRADTKALFDAGRVRVDGRIAKKGQSVAEGQQVEVRPLPTDTAATPDASLALEVLAEDSALIFVNKPARVPSHPLKPGELGTVANALVSRFPECAQASEDPREGGLCHRLDVETSGVLLAARNRSAWLAMREAFSTKDQVDKRYWAVAVGPLADEGEIDLPLRHHPRHPDRVEAVVEGGPGAREALSHVRVLRRRGDHSLVEVQIHTGVLHQVRAHLAAIGAPLLGDLRYGGPAYAGLDRFFLHARSLSLRHPEGGRRVTVEAPLPAELVRVLDELSLQ